MEFTDLDELIVIADIRHVQKLNKWEANESGGLEIRIANFDNIDALTEQFTNI